MYKNKKICNRAGDNYAYASEFVPNCYKTQNMCNKVVNTSPSAIQFVSEFYKKHCCVWPFVFDSDANQYKSQEVYDTVISEDPFFLKDCPGRYNTQEISHKVLDACLPTLTFVSDGFVIKKMIKKLDDAIFFSDVVVFLNDDSGNVTFYSDEMGFLSVDLNNINLDDDDFNEDEPETIHVRLVAWHNKYKQHKACKNIQPDISYRMVGLVHARRWVKRKKNVFG